MTMAWDMDSAFLKFHVTVLLSFYRNTTKENHKSTHFQIYCWEHHVGKS